MSGGWLSFHFLNVVAQLQHLLHLNVVNHWQVPAVPASHANLDMNKEPCPEMYLECASACMFKSVFRSICWKTGCNITDLLIRLMVYDSLAITICHTIEILHCCLLLSCPDYCVVFWHFICSKWVVWRRDQIFVGQVSHLPWISGPTAEVQTQARHVGNNCKGHIWCFTS